MDLLKSAAYFFAVLSVLVIAHEWGHFIVAKLFNMRVDDFSLFFGPRIWRVGSRNGTEYNVRSIPFGGFVKIAGMEPDEIVNSTTTFRGSQGRGSAVIGLDPTAMNAIDADQVSVRIRDIVERSIGENGRVLQDGKEELESLLLTTGLTEDEDRYIRQVIEAYNYLPDPNGFNQKPLWQRAAVIGAGPFMSVLFGYLLFCVMGFTVGLPYDAQTTTVIAQVTAGRPADKVGLNAGDRIISINNTRLTSGSMMVDIIHASIGKPLTLLFERNHMPQSVVVTPISTKDPYTGKLIGVIGIQPEAPYLWRKYPPFEAIRRGSDLMKDQVQGFGMMFSKPKELKDNVGGVLRIASMIHQNSQEGPKRVLFTAAMLSVSLGVMNLLPIPILDGGHLVMLAIEGIRRRRMTGQELYTFQMVGISIIGVLFVLVMYNDIVHMWFTHGQR